MPAPTGFVQSEVEQRIRNEFACAFTALENATSTQRADAAARLNRAVRRLYDFVGYGKLADDLVDTTVLTRLDVPVQLELPKASLA